MTRPKGAPPKPGSVPFLRESHDLELELKPTDTTAVSRRKTHIDKTFTVSLTFECVVYFGRSWKQTAVSLHRETRSDLGDPSNCCVRRKRADPAP